MRVKLTHPAARLPAYATPGSVGLDLYLCESVYLVPRETQRIGLGICIELPAGCEGQIRPRSSMSEQGCDVFLGTIDNDYRGELSIIAHNRTSIALAFDAGQRIAQLVVAPVVCVVPHVVDSLSETERGAGGFGSTGK